MFWLSGHMRCRAASFWLGSSPETGVLDDPFWLSHGVVAGLQLTAWLLGRLIGIALMRFARLSEGPLGSRLAHDRGVCCHTGEPDWGWVASGIWLEVIGCEGAMGQS